MLSGIIPKIFFNDWFWIGIWAVIFVILHFSGIKLPSPKTSKFLTKHKKTINKMTDIGIIFFLLIICLPLLIISMNVFKIEADDQIRSTELMFAWSFFFIMMVICSALSAFLLGLLSIFQSNITSIKRIFLLALCLLPVIFTVFLLFLDPVENKWSTVKLGLIFSFSCWVVNGPAIILGKPFIKTMWNVMRKLRLVSGEYPE